MCCVCSCVFSPSLIVASVVWLALCYCLFFYLYFAILDAPDGARKRTMFRRPLQLSAKLAAFTGVPYLSRGLVVKLMWKHIKANNLQDPSNGQNINCDDTLQDVLGCSNMTMFTMNKFLQPIMFKIEDAAELEKAWTCLEDYEASNADLFDGDSSSSSKPKREKKATKPKPKKAKKSKDDSDDGRVLSDLDKPEWVHVV